MNSDSQFLHDLKLNSVNLPYPLQKQAAEFIASAYKSQPDPLHFPLEDSLSTELSNYGVAGTVSDAQNLILRSHFGTMGEFAQNILRDQHSRVKVGDAFDEATLQALEAFPTFDPAKGSITNYLVNTFRGAFTDVARGKDPFQSVTGVEMDALGTDLYGDPWGGTTAPIDPGEPLKWYENLTNSLSGSSVPTGLYAPAGQSLMVGGQLNPLLTTHPVRGSQQLWISQQDMQEFSAASQAGGLLGAPQLVSRVQKSLRSLSTGMQGLETVGGDVLGANMSEWEAQIAASQPKMASSQAKFPRQRSIEDVTGDVTNFEALQIAKEYNQPYAPTLLAQGEVAPSEIDPNNIEQAFGQLATSPAQQLAARMAHEMRVTGRIGPNAIGRYKQNVQRAAALRAENAAGNLAVQRVRENASFTTDNTGGVPEELLRQYEQSLAANGEPMTQSNDWEAGVPIPEDGPMPEGENIASTRDWRSYSEPAAAPVAPVQAAAKVSGVRNFADAQEARTYIEKNFPDYAAFHLGRGPEHTEVFEKYKSTLGDRRVAFEEAHGVLMADQRRAASLGNGTPSVYNQWVKQNGGYKYNTPAPASSSTPAAAVSTPVDNADLGSSASSYTPSPAGSEAEEIDQTFRGPWEAHVQQGATTAGASALPLTARERMQLEEANTPGPAIRTVTSNMVSSWMGNAANLSINSAAGFNSSRLGDFQVTSRSNGGHGVVTGGHIVDAAGQEMLSQAGVEQAVNWAQRGSQAALAQGGMEGMDPQSAVATFRQRAYDAVNGFMDQFVKEAGGASPETRAAAQITASRISEVAKDTIGNITDGIKANTNQVGNNGDFQYNAVRVGRDAKALEAHMANNPELSDYVASVGGAEAAANGPVQVRAFGANVYQFGNNGRGGYGGGYGGGGRIGGGDPGDEGEFAHKSPRQTDFGRLMMTAYMGQLAWNYTGGAVMKEADAYGMGEAAMAPLDAYGDGVVSGPSAYASQKAMAARYTGQMAYQSYGLLQNAGYTFGGGAVGDGLTQVGQAGMVGLGAGAAAGMGAYGLGMIGMGAVGAAALPIGATVGAAVGGPLLGMAAFNAFTGQTPDQGLSIGNYMRGAAVAAAEVNQSPSLWNVAKMAFSSAQGHDIDAALASDFKGQADIDVIKSGLGPLNQMFPNLAASLVGGTKKQDELANFAQGMANDTGLQYADVAKQLTPIQSMLGGLDSDYNKKMATSLVNLSQDTGMDQASVVHQMASARGLAPGSREYKQLIQNYLGMDSSEARTSFISQQQHDVQGFSQFAPYLEGSTYDAGQLYTGLQMNMPQSQQFASIASGVAMSQGSELSTAQQWNLGALSQQLGKYSTMMGSVASTFDMAGVGNYSSVYTNLGGMVASGDVTANYMKDIASGNKYAWSDFGRQSGQGVYQTMQANGLQAGTTDISGLMLYAQQTSKGSSLSALGISDVGYQSALTSGGLWAAEDLHTQRVNAFTQQSFGLQSAQLASNENYMQATYGLQQQQSQIQWGSQKFGFDMSQRQMNLSNANFEENLAAARAQSQTSNSYQNWSAAFNQDTNLMQRGFAREDFNYQQQMNSMQYGWSMEDINTQIRRSSGFDRAQLIKQRDRMTTTQSMETEHASDKMDQQEELWKREDERYQKEQEYAKKLQALDQEGFDRQERQHKAMAALDQESLDERIKTATELHKVELEMQKLQHDHDVEQLDFSKQNLEIQKAMNAEQVTYQKMTLEIGRLQAQQAADWQKIASYSPAFKDALNAFYNFMVNTVQNANSGNLGNGSYVSSGSRSSNIGMR